MDKIFLALIVLALILILSAVGAYNNRKNREYIKRKIKENYGGLPMRIYHDGEYEHICGYFANHKSNFSIDDITWNDLNMDEMFARMNYTRSSAGEEFLYNILRSPNIDGIDENFEKKVDYFASNEEERLKVSMMLFDCGRTGKYSIYDYLNNLDNLEGLSAKSDILIVMVYIVAAICFVINIEVGILAFIFAFLLGALTYFSKKKKIEPYITCFSYVFRMIGTANALSKNKCDATEDYCEKLHALSASMNSFGRFSGLVMNNMTGNGNPLEIIVEYSKIFLHLDIIKFFHMLDQINKHWDDIDSMIEIVGKIDCAISIAYYRASLAGWCNPTFTDEGIETEGVYHPLLNAPVDNDITIKKGVLLTGSNASGKSTFLKTVAINIILAQAINTCMARSFRASHFRVYTSLALQDSIFDGESYYMTEIKSLKRIIDEGKKTDVPIFACVDEVLRGTNTIERVSASSVILRNLSYTKGIIMAATHDLELATLLADVYDNYHFEENIEGNDISFSYKIMTGKARTRNAIKLLEIMGYDKDIIDNASKVAKHYEETGAFE